MRWCAFTLHYALGNSGRLGGGLGLFAPSSGALLGFLSNRQDVTTVVRHIHVPIQVVPRLLDFRTIKYLYRRATYQSSTCSNEESTVRPVPSRKVFYEAGVVVLQSNQCPCRGKLAARPPSSLPSGNTARATPMLISFLFRLLLRGNCGNWLRERGCWQTGAASAPFMETGAMVCAA